MTNKEIARAFQFLGNIMELHEENPFKIRSYQNAYITLRKLDRPLSEMPADEIGSIKGIGKAITGKIQELLETGSMQTLERYKSDTPPGVQEMLQIKGFGPKKIRVIWKDLGAETIGELLYAVNENRLIELKGFGAKTQADLKAKLEYFLKSKDRFHYARLEQDALDLVADIRQKCTDARVELTGAIRRGCNELESIEILVGTSQPAAELVTQLPIEVQKLEDDHCAGLTDDGFPVHLYFCPPEAFGSKWFRYTGSQPFLDAFLQQAASGDFSGLEMEEAVFEKAGLPFIDPAMREDEWSVSLATQGKLPKLIEENDMKGVVHAHSTYSDGLNTVEEMARRCMDLGYEYLVMTDHSKSAFYANGLQPERVLAQMAEIDKLNQELAPFRIFKSIESDILNDGSLDYEEEMLQQFELIIASVHSNLRMDETKATQRLITAIENPYTRILGHPTGRLLLSREGYPLDHAKVIDACAANGVAIELNANPYRLDLDWSWIPYALEKGVLISINPDAHSLEGIEDIHFGVISARKGGLTAESCVNAWGLEAFTNWLTK